MISSLLVFKVISISRAHFEAQKICYTQNNHNEFNFMETCDVFPGAQQHTSNDTKRVGFANPTFLREPCSI